MNIFIGGAWPYANGSLHLGHISALIPGDIIARYHRLKGDTVCYVSGSDCHGTPIQVRAKKEQTSPEYIANFYHTEFKSNFENLGFSYDYYGSTMADYHKDFVKQYILSILDSPYLYRKKIENVFCKNCNQFLPDRFIVGTCPMCGKDAKGDQCEYCGNLLDDLNLENKKCIICGETPIARDSEHLYISFSKLGDEIKTYINSVSNWRKNALDLSNRYINEGLKDRAITRDTHWGIEVPLWGFKHKRIYVWVDALLGYLSTSIEWLNLNNIPVDTFWSRSNNSKHYYVHGKDNIPFHTIILPSLLTIGGDYHLPDAIISSEHLKLEGHKISTNTDSSVWIPELLKQFDPDTIRYFLIINGPEKRDADFSWREFINSHNGELIGAFGNFINRNTKFIDKNFGGKIPEGSYDLKTKVDINALFSSIGTQIENGDFKQALEDLFAFIRNSNKYFDMNKPWETLKSNIKLCNDTIFTCAQIIANISILLEPFLPFSAKKIRAQFSIAEYNWAPIEIASGLALLPGDILFSRIEKEDFETEKSESNYML